MLEKALIGDKRYWSWLFFLGAVMGIGAICYLFQLRDGLSITGLSRDVSWGFYIAQFTFLVGVAASAVMVVLPYYLHNYKAFSKITILGEFLAISAVLMLEKNMRKTSKRCCSTKILVRHLTMASISKEFISKTSLSE